MDCIDSYDKKATGKETVLSELFVTEMNKLYSESTCYLSEFKLDNTKIEESLSKADEYLDRLRKEELSLKDNKFGGKLMEFNKTETKHDPSLLGSLDCQHLSFKIQIL